MLTDAEYVEAQRRYKEMKGEPHERQRCHALLLLTDGYKAEEVAEILRVEEGTVWRWVKWYRESGLDGLRERRGGDHGQSPLGEAERKELEEYLRETTPPGGTPGSG